MALTQKQEAFVVKYLECGIASDAYSHAYDTGTDRKKTIYDEASRLLAHPEIAQRIKEFNHKPIEKLAIDREYVTEGILRNIKGAEGKEDYSTALKGHDMLGKMYDLNEDKQNDRLVTNKERAALLENFRSRMVDVTPVKE